jgi:hypothetical protein
MNRSLPAKAGVFKSVAASCEADLNLGGLDAQGSAFTVSLSALGR